MRRVAMLLMLAGCGGGAKYKVDDVALAQVPVEEKQGIFQAENEISVAKSEQVKALADASAVDHDIDIADKEQEQAKLERQKAKLERDAAEKSHDVNRVNQADGELKIAELGEKAADAKVDWLSRKKKWHKLQADAAEEHIYAAQSRVELEKAQLAVKRNIKPSEDFRLDNFSADYAKKVKGWEDAKRDADTRKAEADRLAMTYNQLKEQYAQARAPQAPPGGSGPNGVTPTSPASYSPQPAESTSPPPPPAQ